MLRIEHLTASVAGTRILDGVDLDIAAGEVVTLIGASGSGKSTLLRCVNLLEPVDDGVIELDGVDIAEPGLSPDPVRRRIGMVFQSFNLFPHMTVLDNVTLAQRKVLGRSKPEAERIGASIATGIGGLQAFQDCYDVLLARGPDRVNPFSIPQIIPNMGAAWVSMELGTRGPLSSQCTACAASNMAIGEGTDMIRLGRADVVFAGGTEAGITPVGIAGFSAMRALARRNDEPKKVLESNASVTPIELNESWTSIVPPSGTLLPHSRMSARAGRYRCAPSM